MLDFTFTLDIRSNESLMRFILTHSAICDCLSLYPDRSYETPWKEWKERILSQITADSILEADEYRVEFDTEEITVYSQFDGSFVQRQTFNEFLATYDRIIDLQSSYESLKKDFDFKIFRQANADLLVLPAAISIGLLFPDIGSNRVYVSPLLEAVLNWENAEHRSGLVKTFWLKDYHYPSLDGISVQLDEDIIQRAIKLREHSRSEGLKFNWIWTVQYLPACTIRLLSSQHCSYLKEDAFMS